MRKPFFRKSRNCWFVKDDAGRFIRLDENKSKAFRIWKAMPSNSVRLPSNSLASLLDDFLDEHEPQMTKTKFAAYRFLAQSFLDFVGDIYLEEIGTATVLRWLQHPRLKDGENLKPWSSTRQSDAGSAIKTIFKWAEDTDRISKSPLRRIKLPSRTSRTNVISTDDHARLVRSAMQSHHSRSFALYLIASHCGARPQQIRDVEAKDVSPDFSTMVFFKHKNFCKTKKPLVVFVPPCLQTVLKILVAKRPTGKLFLNDLGRPWKKDTICRRMKRLRERLGMDSSVIAYAYRHTFATDALRAGIDLSTVATLLGHSSTVMVSRVYGHLSEHPEHIHEAAAKAAKKRIAGDS
jgi:integrase/recombinase XerD